MTAFHYCKRIELFSVQDKINYSKFKHGSKSIAREYGVQLAKTFIDTPDFDNIIASGKTIVISPAPYNNIPTASFTMKDYFISELALHTIDHPNIMIEEVKINRKHSYSTEYGEMTAEERETAINADTFYIDAEFVKGKHVIFVDDCRITGSHERRIQYMANKHQLDCTTSYLYYAALIDAEVNPKVESELNGFYVKGIDQILALILQGEFVYNTRVVKKILRSSHVDIAKFVARLMSTSTDLAKSSIHTLIASAILNGYHADDTMTYNIRHLNSIISSYQTTLI